MKKIILLVLISLPIFSIGQNNSDIYAAYNKAISNGNFKKAKKELIKISDFETNTFLKYLTFGHFYGQQEQIDSASYYLELAIDYYKYQPISHSTPNFKETKDSLYSVAIDIYDIIIKNRPTSVNYCNRGIYKKDIGLARESLVDFQKAIELEPNEYLNFFNQALAYEQLNILDSALLGYDKAIQFNPKYGSSYVNKGFILIKLDSFELAILEFELALSILESTKEISYAINNIGFCHYKLMDYSRAKSFIEQSINMNPINSYAHKNLALIYIALDDKRNACNSIDEAIKLGFTEKFGDEILKMRKENCLN